MSEIQSHPDRTLAQHLDEIRAAAAGIFGRHCRDFRARLPEVATWFDDSVALHDTGKASPQFQAYIPAPERYTGRKKDKAHTPLSTLLTLHHGSAEGWDWRRTLAVAQVAAGHHSGFRDLEALDTLLLTDFWDVLPRQLNGLDHDALHRAVGRTLPRLDSGRAADAIGEASDLLVCQFRERLDELPLPEAVRYRLLVQMVFSVLLEADKAYLAVPCPDLVAYLAPRAADLPATRVAEYVRGKPATAINHLRDDARTAMATGLAGTDGRLFTMTLPTGTGKTLLAASWALETRERLRDENGVPPPVLIVLPFLTVIEQTAREYEQLFPGAGARGLIAHYHSLSDRTFAPGLEEESQEFFLDTWRSDVVITTFDQFLYALLSPKAKHQMRFHHLADAVVVLDEVQALPCELWEPLRHALGELTRLGSTRVLAMSATQPGFLPEARELIGRPEQFFRRMSRYRLVLRHRSPTPLSEFVAECRGRLAGEWSGKRVMVTLNTRRSARRVRDALADEARRHGFQVEFLTADVTPADRLRSVERIKRSGRDGTPCLVVSTQCVEAGVDIDLDVVVRDFGPLDSLIQIAGRCNRNGRPGGGVVEIVRLVDDESDGQADFAKQVYDKVLLGATHTVLADSNTIDEEDVYPVTRRYFDELSRRKDTGLAALNAWAYWRELPESVRTMLRGPDRPQETFVVVGQDPALRPALEAASALPDRWQRRRALRALAGRVAQVSVSVYARDGFDPADFGDPFPVQAARDKVWFWLLRPGYYTSERGVDFGGRAGDDVWGLIV